MMTRPCLGVAFFLLVLAIRSEAGIRIPRDDELLYVNQFLETVRNDVWVAVYCANAGVDGFNCERKFKIRWQQVGVNTVRKSAVSSQPGCPPDNSLFNKDFTIGYNPSNPLSLIQGTAKAKLHLNGLGISRIDRFASSDPSSYLFHHVTFVENTSHAGYAYPSLLFLLVKSSYVMSDGCLDLNNLKWDRAVQDLSNLFSMKFGNDQYFPGLQVPSPRPVFSWKGDECPAPVIDEGLQVNPFFPDLPDLPGFPDLSDLSGFPGGLPVGAPQGPPGGLPTLPTGLPTDPPTVPGGFPAGFFEGFLGLQSGLPDGKRRK